METRSTVRQGGQLVPKRVLERHQSNTAPRDELKAQSRQRGGENASASSENAGINHHSRRRRSERNQREQSIGRAVSCSRSAATLFCATRSVCTRTRRWGAGIRKSFPHGELGSDHHDHDHAARREAAHTRPAARCESRLRLNRLNRGRARTPDHRVEQRVDADSRSGARSIHIVCGRVAGGTAARAAFRRAGLRHLLLCARVSFCVGQQANVVHGPSSAPLSTWPRFA